MARRALALALTLALAPPLLAGCGAADTPGGSGSSAPPSGSRKPEPPGSAAAAGAGARPRAGLDPKLVAALGDSITAGSPLWDPDPAFREQIAAGRKSTETSQWGYWYERAHPGVTVRNCGVFGERTDEIARRLEECERGAATLVVQGGINDIAQGRDVADAARDLDAMVARGQADGRAVALVEVLPWNNGYPDAAPQIDALNARIRAIGKARAVPVFPWYGALEDPAAPDRMRADLTVEGDHPSVAGYRRLAGLVDLP